MTIETEIVARLLADGTVSGLVGARVEPLLLPQNPAWPSVVYQRISGVGQYVLSGPSGRTQSRMQLAGWAETYAGALALADAVRASLDGFNGLLVAIEATIRLENQQDAYEEEPRKFRVIQDYSIFHT